MTTAPYPGKVPTSTLAVYASWKARGRRVVHGREGGFLPVAYADVRRLYAAPGIYPVTACTVQGMARVRSGQAPA